MKACRCTRCSTEEDIPTHQNIILYGSENGSKGDRYDLCVACWQSARRRVTVLSNPKNRPNKNEPEYKLKDGLDLKIHTVNGMMYMLFNSFLRAGYLGDLEKKVNKK